MHNVRQRAIALRELLTMDASSRPEVLRVGVGGPVGSGKTVKGGKVIPLDVKAGDRVLFGKYSGSESKIDGEDTLILREADILAVIES